MPNAAPDESSQVVLKICRRMVLGMLNEIARTR